MFYFNYYANLENMYLTIDFEKHVNHHGQNFLFDSQLVFTSLFLHQHLSE